MIEHKKDGLITHIAGTFLIDAPASFLNGAGLGAGEDRNVSIIKAFKDGQYRIPYVSSQAWKRWLRNTLIEETGWNASELRALHVNKKGNTDKIGGEFNPVEFAEDDVFGYMRTEKKDVEEDSEEPEASKSAGKKVKALTRASPFSASILISLRKTGWQGKDEAFVHLKEGTPQPYTTEFYNTNLQGVFCLNYRRLGLFSNIGDRIELDEAKVEEFVSKNKIRVIEDKGKSGKIYEMTDPTTRKERTSALLKALSRLRGGAKQAAFGTDVSPKVMILAGLTCGNPIFNGLFIDDGTGPMLKVDTLKEIVKDYSDRISTP
ncbi:MAG: type I-B CRISPR-associated protein Cas7/Cst2/DevR, partial [Nitrosopumilaceae archaeon]